MKGWDWEGRVERVGVETRVVSLLTMGKETRGKEERSRKRQLANTALFGIEEEWSVGHRDEVG